MIVLRRDDCLRLLRHARCCLPEEACGLLAGSREEERALVEKVYLLENADHSVIHFSISPREQLEAILDMRCRGLVLLGGWHSHPTAPAFPSKEDICLAPYPHASHVILSLAGEAPVLRSFHICGTEAAQEELVVE